MKPNLFMNSRLFFLIVLIVVFTGQVMAQDIPKKEYYAGECSMGNNIAYDSPAEKYVVNDPL